MSRARLLYVPVLAALEARPFAERAADWAEVASFDAPGVGGRPPGERGVAGVVAAGLDHLDRLGWRRCAIVCDSHAQAAGIEIALRARERVGAIFVGHAAHRYTARGPGAALVPALHDAAHQLLETDYRSFGRAITQLTQGAVDDAYADAWIEAVPQPVAKEILTELSDEEPELVTRLRDSDLPALLGRHEGCVLWTDEGFEQAAAAVPHARTVACRDAPTQDARFIGEVRELSAASAC